MDYDMLFSIGELANICGITPKTLRYYDKLGLLKPAYINTTNGYRFYTRWHITRISTIKQLQNIGISLDDIHTFFMQDDETNIVGCLSGLLKYQEKYIAAQLTELEQKQKKIRSLQLQCETLKGKTAYDESIGITIRPIPKRRILYTSYHGTYTPGLFRKCYQELLSDIKAAGYDPGEMELSAPLSIFCISENRNDSGNADIKLGYEMNNRQEVSLPALYIDEGLYACCICRGPYNRLKTELSRTLHETIKDMGYQIFSPQIAYYYIHEVIAEDKNYLTEIQIPVKIMEI